MAAMVSTAELKSSARTAIIQFILSACEKSNEPCWYSVPGRHDKSLRTLMFLSDEDYAAILLAAELVSVNKQEKVSSSLEAWKSFLSEGAIPNYNPIQQSKNEVEATNSDINANIFVSHPRSKTVRVVLLRIGNNADGEVSKASMMLNDGCEPPQHQSLRSARSDLNNALRPIIKEIRSNNDTRLDAVMKWIDMEHLKRIDGPDTGHNKPSPDPTTETTAKEPMTITNKTKEERMYPSLAKYGLLDIIDRSGDEAEVLRNEVKMNGILNDIVQYTKANETSVTISSWSKGARSELVQVRPCKEGDNFYKLAARTGWIEDMLTACIDPSNDDDNAVRSVIDYLLRRHEVETRDALADAGVIPRILDSFEVAALMDRANLGVGQWREVVKCLKTFQGLDTISVPEKVVRMLGMDHGKVTTGVFHWQREEGQRKIAIRWWTMDPKDEVFLRLADYANGTANFHPNTIDTIFAVFSGDHGTGKHRFICKLVVRTTKREKWYRVFPLGDISSSKDSCDIFKGTIKDNLASGINDIVGSYVKFTCNESNGKWECCIIHDDDDEYDPMSSSIIPIVAVMVGDYKFYSQMLGKEGYDSYWCPHCKLNRTEWQAGCDYNVEGWDLLSLRAQHQSNINTNAEGIEMKGVKEDPYFVIPVDCYVPGTLHLKLGNLNNAVDYVVDFADKKVQPVSPEQHQLRQDVKKLFIDIQLAMEEKDYWDSDNDDAGKEIVKRAKVLLRQLNKQPIPSEQERESLELQIQTELDRKKELTVSLKAMRDAKTAKVKKLASFASARKSEEHSLVTAIDKIFQEYGILRAQYHGGELSGGHLNLLMDHAKAIMKKVEDQLLQALSDSQNANTDSIVNNSTNAPANADDTTPLNANATTPTSSTNATTPASSTNAIAPLNANATNPTCPSLTTDDEIRHTCKNVLTYLLLWDKFLSLVHTEYPTDVDCDNAQDCIDKIVQLADSMGMSRSIKMHVCKDHLVSFMRRFRCGLLDFSEQFMEQYHQTGARLDNKYRNMSDEKEAIARASRQRRTENTLTQGAITAVDTRFKRKRSGNGEANEKLKQLEKNEKRNQQLEQIEISESVIPHNNGLLLTANDNAGSPHDVAEPDNAGSPPDAADKDNEVGGNTGAV